MTRMAKFETQLTLPTPCQLLDVPNLFGMPVWIKRDDLLHPVVSGNKYRKLKYPLQNLAVASAPKLITMGGLWSNHVHAVAHAAASFTYPSLALIRGHDGSTSAMLEDCVRQGMQIRFVDRQSYQYLRSDPLSWQTFVADAGGYHWLPEGGSDPSAVHGVAESVAELPFIPDVMIVACGTGATLAGLLAGLNGRSTVIGIAVIGQGDYLRVEVSRLLRESGYPDFQNYQLLTDRHHGGYAKTSPRLNQFCRDMAEQTGVPVEPVYTGKMFFALRQLIQSGDIALNQSVVAVHTGGLQGLRSGLMDAVK